ncbi:hypothetical protein PTKIN_Ptkin10aG0145600 [Pterospermum kingtungense]
MGLPSKPSPVQIDYRRYRFLPFFESFDPIRSPFCASDEGVSVAYMDLITASKKTLDSILELQEVWLSSRNLLPAYLITYF